MFLLPIILFLSASPIINYPSLPKIPIIACLANLAPCVWPRETAVKSFHGFCVWRTYFFNNVCSQPVTQRSGKQHRSGVLASRRISRAVSCAGRLRGKGAGRQRAYSAQFFCFTAIDNWAALVFRRKIWPASRKENMLFSSRPDGILFSLSKCIFCATIM